MLKFEIIKEDLTRLNGPVRFYVIATPINETGICFEFETRESAQAWIDAQHKQAKAIHERMK